MAPPDTGKRVPAASVSAGSIYKVSKEGKRRSKLNTTQLVNKALSSSASVDFKKSPPPAFDSAGVSVEKGKAAKLAAENLKSDLVPSVDDDSDPLPPYEKAQKAGDGVFTKSKTPEDAHPAPVEFQDEPITAAREFQPKPNSSSPAPTSARPTSTIKPAREKPADKIPHTFTCLPEHRILKLAKIDKILNTAAATLFVSAKSFTSFQGTNKKGKKGQRTYAHFLKHPVLDTTLHESVIWERWDPEAEEFEEYSQGYLDGSEFVDMLDDVSKCKRKHGRKNEGAGWLVRVSILDT